jgi:lipopolysaccharide export LptBFGC system permease protein LptF
MILQRYILKELVTSFLFTFVTILAICLLGTLFQVFRAFEGLGADLLLKVAPMAAGYVAPWAMAVASCTSATLVYGRLAAENEIDAMRMSGVHTARILWPAVLFGVLLVVAAYGINEHAAPAAHFARRKMIRESVLTLLRLPPPGNQRFTIGKYKLSYVDYRDGRMEKPYLMKFDGVRLAEECRAASGKVDLSGPVPQLIMSRPTMTRYEASGKVTDATAGNDFAVPLEIEDLYATEKRPDDMHLDELWRLLAENPEPKKRAAVLTVIHLRYAQSLAPLALVLVAVPIGVFVKRGSRLAGLGAALPPLLLYFVLFFAFQGMGEKGRVPPVAAAYAPDAALLAISFVLLGGVFRK